MADLTADDPRHGKNSTYINHRCRCEKCKAAHAEYERGRRVIAAVEGAAEALHLQGKVALLGKRHLAVVRNG